MEYCLTTYNLAKSYGRKPVLRNVNMHVERGADRKSVVGERV